MTPLLWVQVGDARDFYELASLVMAATAVPAAGAAAADADSAVVRGGGLSAALASGGLGHDIGRSASAPPPPQPSTLRSGSLQPDPAAAASPYVPAASCLLPARGGTAPIAVPAATPPKVGCPTGMLHLVIFVWHFYNRVSC